MLERSSIQTLQVKLFRFFLYIKTWPLICKAHWTPMGPAMSASMPWMPFQTGRKCTGPFALNYYIDSIKKCVHDVSLVHYPCRLRAKHFSDIIIFCELRHSLGSLYRSSRLTVSVFCRKESGRAISLPLRAQWVCGVSRYERRRANHKARSWYIKPRFRFVKLSATPPFFKMSEASKLYWPPGPIITKHAERNGQLLFAPRYVYHCAGTFSSAIRNF